MFSSHVVVKRASRSPLASIPRAVVGIALGLVFVLAQGQSEASPIYSIGVASDLGTHVDATDTTPLNQSFAMGGTVSRSGGAKAGPEGLGAFSMTSSTASPGQAGFGGSVVAIAILSLSDIMITPLPGTAALSFVPGSLNLHLSGSLLNSANGGMDGVIALAGSGTRVDVDGALDGVAFLGFSQRCLQVGFGTGGCGGPFPGDFSTSGGLLDGYAGGDALLTVPEMSLPVDQPISLFLRLNASSGVRTDAQGSLNAASAVGEADFFSTLSFPTSGPVFNLPSGYTANSVDGLIQNNQFVGATAAVPEPGTWLLLASGLGLFFASRWHLRVR